ncbi:MAG: arylsulfatase [Pirellula sp.]|nr:arylsulfatase [Pirellula sp.]
MKYTQKKWIGLAATGLALLISSSPIGYGQEVKEVEQPTNESLPNVVVILSDDLGYGSIGAYGAPDDLVRTPNVDRLAKEGRRFTNAYTGSSVCSPTRYGLLTGRYAFRTELKRDVLNPFAPLHIEKDRLNVASLLKGKGYTTAAIGKWHLGYGNAKSTDGRTDYRAKLSPGPLDIGFDYHFGVPSNHGDLTGVYVENYYVFGLRTGKIENGDKISGPSPSDERFATDYSRSDGAANRPNPIEIDAPRRKDDQVMSVLSEKASDWIRSQTSNKPFFLYYTPIAIHNPITPSTEKKGTSSAGPYGDWIHELDASVGEILKALDEKGFADNTIVVFTSDNGGVYRPFNKEIEQTKSLEKGLKPNGSLRGGKHTVYEGGFRVPYLVRWPRKIAAGTESHDVVGLVDTLATLSDVVGEPLPPAEKAAQDSYSILPAWIGNEDNLKIRRDIITHSADGVFAIRKGPWKWIEGVAAGPVSQDSATREDNFKSQLFNLELDPTESRDLSTENPEIVSELKELLDLYKQSGYSRELPTRESIAAASAIPSLTFPIESLPKEPWKVVRGNWRAVDGVLVGTALARQPAALSVPLKNQNVSIQFDVKLSDAQRQTVRFDIEGGGSYRFDLTTTGLAIVKNGGGAQGGEQQANWAQVEGKLNPEEWYTVHIRIENDKAYFSTSELKVETTQELIAKPRVTASWVIAGGTSSLRSVKVE